MDDDPRETAGLLDFLRWILSDDRRTARAVRLVLATAAWTAPPMVVIGLLSWASRAGAGLLISIVALVTMTLTIAGTAWLLQYRSRRAGLRGVSLVRGLGRRARRIRHSLGRPARHGRHSLDETWPGAPAYQHTRPVPRPDGRDRDPTVVYRPA